MKNETIHLRNMCCQRCIEAVSDELKNLKLKISYVKLGEARYAASKNVSPSQIESALNKRGFIVVKNEDEILVDKIKSALFDLIHQLSDTERKKIALPAYLEGKILKPYRTLLKIFKERKGISIEKYYILQKIEKVKELIERTNLSFSEIAYSTHYKSPQHLSAQFRQVTGKTMAQYKASKHKTRKFIDKI